jgi:hypothetical protein
MKFSLESLFGWYVLGSLVLGAIYWLISAVYGPSQSGESLPECSLCHTPVLRGTGQVTAGTAICQDCLDKMRWESDGGK